MLRNLTNVQTKLKQLTVQINSKHEQCQAEPARALLSACTIGNLLLQIKAILSESEWRRWLQDCCCFSEASAQTYMVIAARGSFLLAPQKALPQIAGALSEKQVENKEVDEIVVPTALIVEKEDSGGVLAREKTGDRSPELTAKLIVVEPEESGNYSDAESEKKGARSLESTPKSTLKLTETPAENSAIKKEVKTETKSNTIVFYVPGNVVPKARPRVTSKGTYLPRKYRQWRNMAEVEICRQVLDMNISDKLPIKKAAIYLSFCGKHRTNSDLDNMAGACLDALTLNGAGVLKDDRLSCIPKLNVEYVAGEGETGVWITIELID